MMPSEPQTSEASERKQFRIEFSIASGLKVVVLVTSISAFVIRRRVYLLADRRTRSSDASLTKKFAAIWISDDS